MVAEVGVEVRSRSHGEVPLRGLVMGLESKDGMTQMEQGRNHVFRDGCDCGRSSNAWVAKLGLVVC